MFPASSQLGCHIFDIENGILTTLTMLMTLTAPASYREPGLSYTNGT